MEKGETSVASTIGFSDLCVLLDSIKYSKQISKVSKLKEFIDGYRRKGDELKRSSPDIETSFFPVLRLLVPRLERERSAYGLKESALARSIIKVLCLPNKGEDAHTLYNFQSSTKSDFADAAYGILRKHFSTSSGLNVADVNEHLDAIARKRNENDIRGQEDEIFKLFKLTSPIEQKWILRIILKDLNVGLGHNRILKLYHPDAADLFDNNSSLSATCETLHDPNVRINEIAISLFTPFRPMLSQRCDAKEFLKSVKASTEFFVETKFDGERFQIHMQNGSFRYFSRNGYDFTGNYGGDYTSGLFSPMLRDVIEPHVRSIILDGEMMGWNVAKQTFGSKGMAFDVKKLSDTSKHQPCFCVFDMLLLNDKVLTNMPLKERLDLLESVVTPKRGTLVISEKVKVSSRQDVLNALNQSMDRKEEGIVFKNPHSLYVPNDRKGGWWKMKLEYFTGVMSDLDVIIMGGFYGKGRKVSGFLVGVAKPPKRGANPTKFLSLAKISSGLNASELDELNKKIGSHWNKTADDTYEDYGLVFGKEKPDVWIRPEKSCILLVRASELIKLYGTNPDYGTDYTLRFPRIQAVRFDKPYYDCLTTVELNELTASSTSVEKLYKRHLELTDIESECPKVKKRRSRFTVDLVQGVEQNSNILLNYEFCVLTGDKKWKKMDVERAIAENGGDVVKIEGKNTFCILCGDDHPRIPHYKGSVDIVKLSWLQTVINNQEFSAYEPEDMVFTTSQTRNRFMSEYDKYGDSYTKPATRKSLAYVLKNVKKLQDYIYPMDCEIDALHEDMDFLYKFDLFRNHVAYFDRYKVINEPESEKLCTSTLEMAEFQFWGGKVSEYLTKDINLVVLNSENELRFEEVSKYLRDSHNEKADIVTKLSIIEKIADYKEN